MGIHITCDYCSKAMDFGGDWRRVQGGKVACVPCQEIVAEFKSLERMGTNLMLHRDSLGKLGLSTSLADDVILLHKSYTNAVQELMLLTGDEF